MKIRWTAFFTMVVLAVTTIPVFAGTLDASKSSLSASGPGRIAAHGEDLVVTLEDDARVTEVTVLGGAWLDPVRTEGQIAVEYSEGLAVRIDDVPVLSIDKDNSSVRGIRVIRYDKNNFFRDAVRQDPMSTDIEPDLITCGAGSTVTGDDECVAGGPGAGSATYRCGFWVFSVDTAVTCNAGYYACIRGCGFADCRNLSCAPPPPVQRH